MRSTAPPSSPSFWRRCALWRIAPPRCKHWQCPAAKHSPHTVARSAAALQQFGGAKSLTFPATAAPSSGQGMDLASELRRLLVGYNRALGADAT